jgi:spore maturation protein CgeB
MKFLIIGEIHHPEELAKAERANAPGAPPVLFPPSQGPYFWAKALRGLGHEVEAFIRNVPALFGVRDQRSQRHTFTRFNILSRGLAVVGARAPRLHPDYQARNRRLLAHIARFRPDWVLLNGGNQVILPETLAAIKKLHGAGLVYLSGVSPIVFSHAIERDAAPLYDLAVVNDYYHGVQWLELVAKRMEALPLSACDPDFHKPYALTSAERAEYGCDLGFVGTLIPPRLYAQRVAALEAVRDLGLGVWSIHGVPEALRGNYRGPALGEKMLRMLCGSQIQINPHGDFMRYGGNMRLFEAAGCGVFQIADDLPGTRDWFAPGVHLATYRDPAHLREVARYYLDHPDERREIAAAAQAYVYAVHTYAHRMAALVTLLQV